MAVESFLIEEVAETEKNAEETAEWHKLVDECNLLGQLNVATAEKSPIPFPSMNAQAELVYNTLCPTHMDVERYSAQTIPVRVLALIALSQREHYFHSMEVWSDDKGLDPIIVGSRKNATESWRTDKWIVARWGDELRSFVELKQAAIKRYAEQKTAELREEIAKKQSQIENALILTESKFAGTVKDWSF